MEIQRFSYCQSGGAYDIMEWIILANYTRGSERREILPRGYLWRNYEQHREKAQNDG